MRYPRDVRRSHFSPVSRLSRMPVSDGLHHARGASGHTSRDRSRMPSHLSLHYLLVYLLDYPTIFGVSYDNYYASVRHISSYLSNINVLPSIFNKTNRRLNPYTYLIVLSLLVNLRIGPTLTL